MTTSPRHSSAGYSLLEAITVVALLIILFYTVVELSVTANEASKYNERVSRATEVNQEILNEVRGEVLSSLIVFGNDSVGQAYRDLMATLPGVAAIDSSVLPTVDLAGVFERETTAKSKTGNSVLFARQAWTTPVLCGSGLEYRIDVYRVVYYFLAKEGPGPQPGSNIGLNLCKISSEPLADAEQIARITDSLDQAEVLNHLVNATPDRNGQVHPPVELVWKPGQDPATAGTFEQIDASTDTLSSSPLSPRTSWTLKPDSRRSSKGLLYYRHFSVSTNFAKRRLGVGRFGLTDASGDGFPHGLEVQVIGPASARQVLIHLSIATTNRSGQVAFSDLTSNVFVEGQ